jgi:hypothetical protein
VSFQLKVDKGFCYLLFSIVFISALTFYYNFFHFNIFALPSFVRQEINVTNTFEKTHVWYDVYNGGSITNLTQFFQPLSTRELDVLDNLDKLQSVSYTSDGHYLNATLWLSNSFKPIPQCGCTPSYVMLIDADSNNLTGSYGGVDYMAQILWNNKTNSWTYDLEEFSLTNTGRVIEKIDNYTGFFTKEPVAGNNFAYNDRSVSIPLDLNKIGPIVQGRAIFSVEYDFKLHDIYNSIGDFSKWVPIPPPLFSITTIPTDITIRSPGQQMVEVIVESNNTLPSNVTLDIQKIQGLFVKNLDKLQKVFSIDGTVKFPLLITYNDTNSANLSRLDKLPISIKITFPSSSFNIKNSSALLSAPTVPTIARSFITLSLQPPYSFYEFIATASSYFAQSFGGFVALLATIGGAIYGLWKLILRKRNDKEENRKTDFDNSKKTFCRYCGNVMSSLGVYCAFCGKRFNDPFISTSVLEENNMFQCIRCRTYMNGDSIFCLKCGLKIQR